MKKLLKDYEFNQDAEYFDMCYDSLINGNISQAREQFTRMTRKDRKRCYVYFDGFYDMPNEDQRKRQNFFFELI